MAKVHITLVGKEPMPVYQGVLLTKPDKIVLICSAQTENIANTIKMKLSEQKYNNVLIEHLLVEDTSDIKERISFILDHYVTPNDELSMNLVSGAKIWSLMFLEQCSRKDAHIFCISQNGKVLNIRGNSEVDTVEFDMSSQFKLLNNIPQRFRLFTDYDENYKQNADVIRELYKKKLAHDYSFVNLLGEMKKDLHKVCKGDIHAYAVEDRSVELSEYQYIEWNAGDAICAISLSESDDEYYELYGKHAMEMLLNTTWFEYVIAEQMACIYGVENVYTNCCFLSSDGKDKNEVDIIVNTGQKLLFVECKTQVSEITDIDKFARVVENYGGSGSKALFVTLTKMSDLCQEKCNDNRIATIHFREGVYVHKGRTHVTSLSLDKMKEELQDILSTTNI